jgi:hypothetical protein
MSDRKTIVHKIIMISALVFAVAALPFSIKLCHAAIIVVVITWCLEGQWGSKLSMIRQSLLPLLFFQLNSFQTISLSLRSILRASN